MRLTWIAADVLAALPVMAGCSTTPKEHPEWLRKAAGVTSFRIQCTKDLWNRTGGLKGESWQTYKDPVKAQVTDQRNGTLVVQLTGPQLVDLLDKLNELAHLNKGAYAPDPLTLRMYDAIAPTSTPSAPRLRAAVRSLTSSSTTRPARPPLPRLRPPRRRAGPRSDGRSGLRDKHPCTKASGCARRGRCSASTSPRLHDSPSTHRAGL